MERQHDKHIRDPLYGFITVPSAYLPLLDHYLMQRLRWIGQLPLEQLVYPSAQHSRFEHSIGTMHLARKAAQALCTNSQSQFHELYKKDSLFPDDKEGDKHKAAFFVDAAGLVGLLHDIGHAPFSHTLEDALRFLDRSDLHYDHETAGYYLAKHLFSAIRELQEYQAIVLEALNKEKDRLSLPPLTGLLRDLVDGPIDVDKGDYVRRDSYHCGTVYGVYDTDRLWNNIVISDRNRIGVTTKGALEAWSLRLARYKMNVNVYKHHVRNITDALLIDIIYSAMTEIQNEPHKIKKILPLRTEAGALTQEMIFNFLYWTDNTLIKYFEELRLNPIEAKIEAFLSRKLYKMGFKLDLQEASDTPSMKPIHDAARRIQSTLRKKGVNFNFIFLKDVVPPVFENQVQQEIRVQNGDAFLPLAEHLGFAVNRRAHGNKNSGKRENSTTDDNLMERHQFLHVFIDSQCKESSLNDVKHKLCAALRAVDIEISSNI